MSNTRMLTHTLPGFVVLGLAALCLSVWRPGDRVAVPPTVKALPHPQTLHKRLLQAQVVVVARCKKVPPKDDKDQSRRMLEGNSYRLDLKEVLLDRVPQDPVANYPFLSDLIPGASMVGATHPVPEDTDVVIFATHGFFLKNHLSLLNWCSNSLVPLKGTLEEYPGPKYEKKEIKAAEFKKLVVQRIKEFADFDWLKRHYEQALGSRHPFTGHDKPVLLRLLLALPDKRVAAYAKELHESGAPDRCRAVLDDYFARNKQLGVLREGLQELLDRAKEGELEGTERFVFPSGAMQLRRPKFERLLDQARTLHRAGDANYLVRQLLPLYRSGEARVGPVLIECGVQEVLVGAVRKVKVADSDQGAFLILVRSRDRSALLAATRLAFLQKDAARTRTMLAAIRRHARFGPAVMASDLSGEQLLEAWQEHWRKHSKSLRGAFPKGIVDQMLGTAKGWSSPGE